MSKVKRAKVDFRYGIDIQHINFDYIRDQAILKLQTNMFHPHRYRSRLARQKLCELYGESVTVLRLEDAPDE